MKEYNVTVTVGRPSGDTTEIIKIKEDVYSEFQDILPWLNKLPKDCGEGRACKKPIDIFLMRKKFSEDKVYKFLNTFFPDKREEGWNGLKKFEIAEIL